MFVLRAAARQQSRFLAPTSARAPALVSISRRFASGDYGSGEHNDLKRSKSELEHPGPAPPNTGSSKGSDKKAEPKIHNASHPKDGEESADVAKHNESMKGRQEGTQKTGNGAQPKILSASPPKEGQEPPEVAKHNEEMKSRAERANEGAKNSDAEKDKVSKDFWKGV